MTTSNSTSIDFAKPADRSWCGGEVLLFSQWLPIETASSLYQTLSAEIRWECHRIRMFGRLVNSPRLSCWIGDSNALYRYSGTDFVPHAWTETTCEIQRELNLFCRRNFNSVLANYYRNERDSMGWHRDDEPELGPTPYIASLSFGAERRFCLRYRPKIKSSSSHRDLVEKINLILPSGSLLIMRGDCQKNYQHSLPKSRKPIAGRINLTFRELRLLVDARETK